VIRLVAHLNGGTHDNVQVLCKMHHTSNRDHLLLKIVCHQSRFTTRHYMYKALWSEFIEKVRVFRSSLKSQCIRLTALNLRPRLLVYSPIKYSENFLIFVELILSTLSKNFLLSQSKYTLLSKLVGWNWVLWHSTALPVRTSQSSTLWLEVRGSRSLNSRGSLAYALNFIGIVSTRWQI
jgi:hypothetical protein